MYAHNANYGADTTFYFRKDGNTWKVMKYHPPFGQDVEYKETYTKAERCTNPDCKAWFDLRPSTRRKLFKKYSPTTGIYSTASDNFEAKEEVKMQYEVNVGCVGSVASSPYYTQDLYAKMVSLAALQPAEANCPPPNKTKKGNTMFDDFDDCDCAPQTDESKQRSYLRGRLSDASYKKNGDLRQAFFIDDQPAPRTINDLIARVKGGIYVIPEGKGDMDYYSPADRIQWRDPSKPKNEVGFKAAGAKMEAAETATMDTVMVGPVADALKALQTFETTDFSK